MPPTAPAIPSPARTSGPTNRRSERPPPAPGQLSFDELASGSPGSVELRHASFVVVDLETTGSRPGSDEITEIGAVRVCGGQVLGEFQTLVRPQLGIPAFIAVLTGITDGMVAGAPPISAALPAFLEFAAGSILVAHNAPFDLGFLRAACHAMDLPWPGFASLDTARIARRALTRDEAPDCRLATLARLFRAETTPDHRALHDARATVDVLHGLIERVGNLGVTTVADLTAYTLAVPDRVRAKRTMADGLPHAPGVYLFRDHSARPLYVGVSKDLRTRVRSYFTAAEQRRRIREMVALADRVEHLVTATELEARVRELRLIADEQPRYNRRSRRQHRPHYVTLTEEPYPRLAIVRRPPAPAAVQLGPLGSRAAAELAVEALQELVPVRRCSQRLARRPRGTACALAELGRCLAPCDGRTDPAGYSTATAACRDAMAGDPSELVGRGEELLSRLAEQGRYERAAATRDRLHGLLSAAAWTQEWSALARIPELVAAAPAAGGAPGSWDVHLIRYARLAAAARARSATEVVGLAHVLSQCGEVVTPGSAGPAGQAELPERPGPAASAEEMAMLLGWLRTPGTRLVTATEGWALPARGAGGFRTSFRPAPGAGAAVQGPGQGPGSALGRPGG